MTTAEKKVGVCPVCRGTGRQTPTESQRPYASPSARTRYAGYDEATDTLPCRNCGGQTMSCRGTGVVSLRPDGMPCEHDYDSLTVGRCYHRHECKFCGDIYHIDSGD